MSVCPGLLAGQELEMPASGGVNDQKIVDAVRAGQIDETLLDERVDRILDLIFRAEKVKALAHTCDPRRQPPPCAQNRGRIYGAA